ncbi:MAG: asparagine synthase (glutamine-hydrolyzing) [Candidatus Omnitrophica bacterium]|nr:asparagine synthase (glutamine-hydrolyzing) [Candidatus Omnitrophota bacterium]MBU1134126.1 asparagine synthase (glutamine-hydrolyzing) [Candidatus Omnitrophota bacterium]
MCGIIGFVINDSQLNKKEAENILFEMCQPIRHRGPDDQGVYCAGFDNQSRVPKVGLGHVRLSIIDLSPAGHQPMSNEDGSIWLSYNGEIYNFLELRECLVRKGHIFRSRTDSEVIIHSYEQWGMEFVNKLNGMFAFALWDGKQGILILIRDRMGQKPLYYSIADGNIIFASEPKAILKFPNFVKEIDPTSLKKYFLYEYVPSPHTIYKNIQKLEAGSVLIWKNKNICIRKYWNISFAKINDSNNITTLKNLLKDSVKKRLISDVPLGVFLSGGIDSSSIVASMVRMMPHQDIKTFSIGFKEASFDESYYARKVARHFGTDHCGEVLNPKAMLEILPEVISNLDEPFADASIIPTYLLSKFTKEHVSVALSGDGADELFAGYPTFPAHRLARIYEKIPLFCKKNIIEKIIYSLPVSFNNLSFDFKLKQFLKGMPYNPEIRNQIWLGSFSPQEQNNLFRKDLMGEVKDSSIFQDIYTSLKDCDARNYLELIIYLYCKFYLQDDILTKTDRASMAHSLEVRAPFLDYRFLEYTFSLPAHLKLRGFTTKYILKKMMKKDLPAGIVNRAKKGFGVPIAKWIKKDIKDLISDELAYEKIKKENLLNPDYIQQLLKEHFKGTKDNRKQLWTLLMFELWYDKWLKNVR